MAVWRQRWRWWGCTGLFRSWWFGEEMRSGFGWRWERNRWRFCGKIDDSPRLNGGGFFGATMRQMSHISNDVSCFTGTCAGLASRSYCVSTGSNRASLGEEQLNFRRANLWNLPLTSFLAARHRRTLPVLVCRAQLGTSGYLGLLAYPRGRKAPSFRVGI